MDSDGFLWPSQIGSFRVSFVPLSPHPLHEAVLSIWGGGGGASELYSAGEGCVIEGPLPQTQGPRHATPVILAFPQRENMYQPVMSSTII